MNKKLKYYTLILATAMALIISMPFCNVDAKTDTTQKSAISGIKAKSEKDKKNEASSVLWKFLQSMLLVAGSCGAIFLLLFAYKKIKKTRLVNAPNIEIEKNLNSPETVEEATRFIIEKF